MVPIILPEKTVVKYSEFWQNGRTLGVGLNQINKSYQLDTSSLTYYMHKLLLSNTIIIQMEGSTLL